MTCLDCNEAKVLIVDDTAENLEIASKILERNNYDLYIADSGLIALELLKNVAFDLILLDIMMPDMDGFETCRRIRSNSDYEDIPIIFLTAKADLDSLVKGFELGAVDYIKKPFSPLELLARVKTHVQLKKITQEMAIVASTDPLTQLLNRREMIKKIEYEQVKYERSLEQFSIILADIDFFKRVNDNYGHEYGDYILKSIADLLKSSLRKQDVIARWGGEEFLILLPETKQNGALILADKIRGIIEENKFIYNATEINITMTFGVKGYLGKISIDELVSGADRALYRGKQEGRNCVMI